MTLIIAGVVLVLAYLANRQVLAYPFSTENPATRYLPLARRINTVVGVCGVVLVVMGLIFPSI
jgi:hypothetical protein